ncbi:hypothetical protein E2542_SST14669 [Spatholobus suberectus]|nr:hypothetical protein E2542_SST14669 [Spatholobus suberectus]
MEGVLKPRQAEEERVGPNKQNRRKKNTRSKFISNPCDNVVATYAGLMNPPSYPFSLPSSFFYHHQQNQQPPLLPLPSTVSPSVKSRKNRSSREMSNYKSKQTMREEVKKKPTQSTTEFLTTTTPVVCTSSFRSMAMAGNGFGTEMMDSASWVFNLSPPPSSLPLPRFCVRRSKLGCNAETKV